ncbi:hypothetical protein [Corallococcus carmarthensis]|uniref:hypothetical protein n=1 Tax=Corallococcus carmarthensis TaxID=2316728 RepID=UPI00148C6F27|nr:hypothetical protein [Corallococcus carmarthensis]NOK22966.1 hypothetical protein [Corallococcus carmarthensis]
MHASPPAEALEARPRARRHLAWVLALARWLKAWAERVLSEHSAALAKAAGLGGAQVRSLPLREPVLTLLPPVPLWPSRMEPGTPVPPDAASPSMIPEAPTPRLNTLRCIPREGEMPDVESEEGPLHAASQVPFGFDPDDLLPAEPVAVVGPVPSPAMLLQAAAMEVPELPPAVSQPLQGVSAFPRDPARDLIALLKESLGTPAQPSVPWSEAEPPSPDEPADAEEMLRQCERLELEPTVE